jgi:peptidoglycan/xylan/chitin deacetylase (PgdA/CDA1 family)
MLKLYLVLVLVLILVTLAGCGGDEEATATPTPLATFTPTAAPTEAPPATATEAATEVPAEAATATRVPGDTDTTDVTATPAEGDMFVPELIAPESPLVAPDSPLPPPAAADAVAPAAEPTATPAPLSGSWRLETIRSASSMTETTAPEGYRLAFSRTGVVRAIADCKTGRGDFERLPDGTLAVAVTFSDTRCAPDSLAEPFARALGEVTSYRFDGDRLVLNYGTQGGEMGLVRAGQMAAFGAPFLSWTNLKNSTFLVPGTPAGDSQAPLVDGEFRARTTPAAADQAVTATLAAPADFVVSLATMHTYGDLDPETPEPAADPNATPTPTPGPEEVSIDSIVVLVVDDNSPAPSSYLAPVLNGGGLAIPLTLESLGENVYVRDLRWDGQQLTIDFDQGTEGKRRVYTFETDRFTLVDEEGLAAQPPRGRLDLPAQEIVLQPSTETGAGAPSASLTGAIEAGVIHPYRLMAQAGQQLTVTLQSPYDDVWLSLFGADDRTVLRSIRAETSSWSGVVPSTQSYLVSAVASGSASPYTLTVELAGQGAPAVATEVQTPTAVPAGDIVHLVIDGIPQAAILDVLQRNDAQVDFFVTAEQATQGVEELNAAAGHGIGIIAGPISALTSDGRDALFSEIGAARAELGGQRGKCLRPPYAATDGYTRAAASELGFDVVLWDIDAGSTPAEELASQLFPGAVIRFADTGDSGQAAAAALETLLPLLAEQGYIVQPQCK